MGDAAMLGRSNPALTNVRRRWVWVLAMVAACDASGLDGGIGGGSELYPKDEPAPVTDPEDDGAVAAPVALDCSTGRPGVGIDGIFFSEYLQGALDAAPAGATIELCGGAYPGPFTALRTVNLVGVAGSAATTLETLTGGTVLTVPPGSTVTGLTLRGGDAPTGGGLRLEGPGTFTLDDCVIEQNLAEVGGGIAIDGGATVSILRSAITDNEADTGGGLFVGPGSAAQFVETRVAGNRARTLGGGAALDGGSLYGGELDGNQVTGATAFRNPAVDGGGGISVTGSATVDGTLVTGNSAANAPGILVRSGTVTLANLTIERNEGPEDEGSAGGGLHCDGASVSMYGTRIAGNRAGVGGGVWAHQCSLSGGTVSENASVGDGGGVVLFRSTLFQATVSENVAGGYPSGVWLQAEAELVDCVVERHGGEWGAIEAGPASRIVESALLDNATCAVLVSGQVSLDNTAIHRNDAGACLLGGYNPTASLVSIGSDWGADENDNAIDLVWGETYIGYGADATFTCTDACDAP